MRFRDTAAIDVAGTAVYGVVGMALAARGHGVWSLVHAQLACELTRSAVAFLRSPLRFERACLDLGVLRDLARFGRHVVAANALGMLQLQLPAMVVGKLLGATSLGLYEMALRWAWMPVQGVTHVAGRVSFPAFARLRDRPDELAAGYARAFQGIVLLALPAGVGLALAADPLIRTLYGARWDGAIAPLRVLAFTGLFHALAATTGEVFKGIGRPGFVTGLAVVYDVVLVVALWLLGMEAGLLGVAVATLVAPLVTAIAAMAVLAQLVPVRGTTLARIVARAAVASAVMATAVWAAAAASPGLAPPLALARSIVVGVAAYVLVVRAVEPEWFGEATSATGLRAKRRPPVAEERAASGAA
jgi:lipopolysaccharide exporter